MNLEFECKFDEEGKLVGKNGKVIVAKSQDDYNLLGEWVAKVVQDKMVNELGLKEVWIPEGEENQCNIFVSNDWEENKDKGLIIIQGAGQVRAGIWSRSVCINESLSMGSMLPYITKAQSENYSIIILNPNFNRNPATGAKIPQNSDMLKHSSYVWENYIRKSPASSLAIAAHSCGGICTVHLLKTYNEEFLSRIKCVALTDSVHGSCQGLRKPCRDYFRAKVLNFAASNQPLNYPLNINNGCSNVSAGHPKHEYTSGCAFPLVFEYFKDMLKHT